MSTHVSAAPLLASSEHYVGGHRGASISWNHLKVAVGSKEILEGIDGKGLSGHLTGGSFCAIMGPSGAGKTTLLNALAGRLPVAGDVAYGGRALSARELRGRIAYVMQEDVLCGTMTPREALLFSASLRLPSHMPLEQKKLEVEQMLTELTLLRCADTLIGDKMIRGISGGEKKRTSIGVELVLRPEVLFLDEPTSGLDSYAAFSVVRNLVQLAKSGCTILCTIHR